MLAPSPRKFNRAAIMRSAWAIAQSAHRVAVSNRYVAQFIGHEGDIFFVSKSREEIAAATPINFAAALRSAWASAKGPRTSDILAAATAEIIARHRIAA